MSIRYNGRFGIKTEKTGRAHLQTGAYLIMDKNFDGCEAAEALIGRRLSETDMEILANMPYTDEALRKARKEDMILVAVPDGVTPAMIEITYEAPPTGWSMTSSTRVRAGWHLLKQKKQS